MIFIFVTNGFEEIETISVVDILRRANLEVHIISLCESLDIIGAHGIKIIADKLFSDTDFSKAKAFIIPGGMPGAKNLSNSVKLRKLLVDYSNKDIIFAAICAGPIVLEGANLLKDKMVTCYPGFEKDLVNATIVDKLVVHDDNLITGKGPGAALEFAFKIVEVITSKEKVEEMKKQMIID